MTDARHGKVLPTADRSAFFEPNGREPELPGYEQNNAPMLGGARRLWSSISAHLLSEQHRAQRARNMDRVWVIRRLRHRIQQRRLLDQETSLLTGEQVPPLSDADALAELVAERVIVTEELEEARRWHRPLRVREHEAALSVVEEYIVFWKARLDSSDRLDREGQNQ